jgi:hypothetical protein
VKVLNQPQNPFCRFSGASKEFKNAYSTIPGLIKIVMLMDNVVDAGRLDCSDDFEVVATPREFDRRSRPINTRDFSDALRICARLLPA